MSGLLRGNFAVKNTVESANKTDAELSLEDRFEREATARLGGSICFVSRQKIQWEVAGADQAVENKSAA